MTSAVCSSAWLQRQCTFQGYTNKDHLCQQQKQRNDGEDDPVDQKAQVDLGIIVPHGWGAECDFTIFGVQSSVFWRVCQTDIRIHGSD